MKAALTIVTEPNTSILALNDDIFGAIISAINGVEITMLTLVCKDFRNKIANKYSNRVIKKSEILKEINIDSKVFDYLFSIDCAASTCLILSHFIRTDQYTAARHIIQTYDKITSGHVFLALKHSGEIFDLLIKNGHKYVETKDTIADIVDGNNTYAFDLLLRYKKSIIPYLSHGINNMNYIMLAHFSKVCPTRAKCRSIKLLNFPAYKYLTEISNIVHSYEIRGIALCELPMFLEYALTKFGENDIQDIIILIIMRDSSSLMKVIIEHNIEISDSLYKLMIRKNATKILALVGFRKHLYEPIIDAIDLDLLELFPDIATTQSMTYAVENNYEIVVDWIIRRGIKFGREHCRTAIVLGYKNLEDYYAK